jgi:hypothetical protein
LAAGGAAARAGAAGNSGAAKAAPATPKAETPRAERRVRFFMDWFLPFPVGGGPRKKAGTSRLTSDRHSIPAPGRGRSARIMLGHISIFMPIAPGASTSAAQTKAEEKLAAWKCQYGISKIPAASGTNARSGPKKRPMKILGTPHLRTNRAAPDSISDIEVLEGLEPVRRRPGMYIGGTDEKALHHLFAEVIDNSMDEAVAGHATFIEVELGADGF